MTIRSDLGIKAFMDSKGQKKKKKEAIWVNSERSKGKKKICLEKERKIEEHMKYFELYFLFDYDNTILLMSLTELFIKYHFMSRIKHFHVSTMLKINTGQESVPKSLKLFPFGSEIRVIFIFVLYAIYYISVVSTFFIIRLFIRKGRHS